MAGLEIERKFLVPELPEGLDRYPSSALRQGYLAIAEDGAEVRVRERGGEATLTIKQGRGRVRREEELPLDADTFARLWPLTEGKRIEKRRHVIPTESDRTIEVDVYGGALTGLVVAEVEFPDERDAERFEPPDWFGAELTGDPRFNNQRLAVDGLPELQGPSVT